MRRRLADWLVRLAERIDRERITVRSDGTDRFHIYAHKLHVGEVTMPDVAPPLRR